MISLIKNSLFLLMFSGTIAYSFTIKPTFEKSDFSPLPKIKYEHFLKALGPVNKIEFRKAVRCGKTFDECHEKLGFLIYSETYSENRKRIKILSYDSDTTVNQTREFYFSEDGLLDSATEQWVGKFDRYQKCFYKYNERLLLIEIKTNNSTEDTTISRFSYTDTDSLLTYEKYRFLNKLEYESVENSVYREKRFYDSNNKLKRIAYLDNGWDTSRVVTFEYNVSGNLTEECVFKRTFFKKFRLEYRFMFEYDTNGLMIKKIFKRGKGKPFTTEFTYNSNNQLISISKGNYRGKAYLEKKIEYLNDNTIITTSQYKGGKHITIEDTLNCRREWKYFDKSNNLVDYIFEQCKKDKYGNMVIEFRKRKERGYFGRMKTSVSKCERKIYYNE